MYYMYYLMYMYTCTLIRFRDHIVRVANSFTRMAVIPKGV